VNSFNETEVLFLPFPRALPSPKSGDWVPNSIFLGSAVFYKKVLGIFDFFFPEAR